MTFNQVVRGSNPRCLIKNKKNVTRKSGVFLICRKNNENCFPFEVLHVIIIVEREERFAICDRMEVAYEMQKNRT